MLLAEAEEVKSGGNHIFIQSSEWSEKKKKRGGEERKISRCLCRNRGKEIGKGRRKGIVSCFADPARNVIERGKKKRGGFQARIASTSSAVGGGEEEKKKKRSNARMARVPALRHELEGGEKKRRYALGLVKFSGGKKTAERRKREKAKRPRRE